MTSIIEQVGNCVLTAARNTTDTATVFFFAQCDAQKFTPNLAGAKTFIADEGVLANLKAAGTACGKELAGLPINKPQMIEAIPKVQKVLLSAKPGGVFYVQVLPEIRTVLQQHNLLAIEPLFAQKIINIICNAAKAHLKSLKSMAFLIVASAFVAKSTAQN